LTLLLQILAGLLAAITIVWLSRHLELARAKKSTVSLAERDAETPPADPPKVSVLVAAKDEQDNIAACVTSWLQQDWGAFEVTVIDDRSTDRTSQILQDIRQSHPQGSKLQILSVRELPEGWAGKNNAMRLGVEAATGEWLLFSDADCRQISNRSISAAMTYALRESIDFLSVLPVLETQTLWERIIQPVAGAVMVFWFNPRRVNDPASDVAYANGAFMLMRRDAYERIGGHDAVKAELNEDMHMARLAKQAGLRLCVVQNDDLYVTRMYRGFRETWRGWSRIFYGCFGTMRQLLTSAAFLCIMSLFPWISMIGGWIGVLAGAAPQPAWRLFAIAATAAVIAQMTVITRLYKISKADARFAIAWPIGATLVVGMLISAMLKALGMTGTAWRGRTYKQGRLASQEPKR